MVTSGLTGCVARVDFSSELNQPIVRKIEKEVEEFGFVKKRRVMLELEMQLVCSWQGPGKKEVVLCSVGSCVAEQ